MTRRRLLALTAAGFALTLAAGFGLGRFTVRPAAPSDASAEAGRKVLYWYDPMVPAQHFDKPGKSPFMDMQLVPKYADEAVAGAPGVAIDAARAQALGLRLATVERGVLPSALSATGVIAFNDRDVAVVQARAAGFVQRVYARAPGDRLAAGAPLADLLVPEWAGAQGEYLAVRGTGDPALIAAARRRLELLGMPGGTIAAVERTQRPQTLVTIGTPSAGVIRTLSVRTGMTLAAGQTLAEVNGLATVWLNAAVPEVLAGQVREGAPVRATMTAYPGETFSGRVTAILPQAETDSRTLTARIELSNPGARLRPGMFGTVIFDGPAQTALLVPTEAVIRTGRRTLVMLAGGGRYQPVEVRAGREAGDRIEILAGLSEGDRVVASGQFLVDSEASLSAVPARPLPAVSPSAAAGPPARYQGVGRIEQLATGEITLSHGPVPALQWPAMTMSFRLADPGLAKGLQVGDEVTFGFDQTPAGPSVRTLAKAAAR